MYSKLARRYVCTECASNTYLLAYLLTYLLTLWSSVLLEKLTVSQLVEELWGTDRDSTEKFHLVMNPRHFQVPNQMHS